MFGATYKASIKTILRSVIFWFALALVLGLAFYRAEEGLYGGDGDPGFVLRKSPYYVQIPLNACRAWVMFYAMPIFTVISAVILLNRDYGDNFFEIERAGNLKPSRYVLGRLAALVTVNLIVSAAAIALAVNWYVFSRGGVAHMTLGDYLKDSFVRTGRCYVCCVIPSILMYIGFTYLLGNLFKSGFAAAAGGLGYVLFSYLCGYQLRFRMPQVYHKYLSPLPENLYIYIGYIDTPSFKGIVKYFNMTPMDPVICVLILTGAAVLWSAVAYWCIRRRKI